MGKGFHVKKLPDNTELFNRELHNTNQALEDKARHGPDENKIWTIKSKDDKTGKYSLGKC